MAVAMAPTRSSVASHASSWGCVPSPDSKVRMYGSICVERRQDDGRGRAAGWPLLGASAVAARRSEPASPAIVARHTTRDSRRPRWRRPAVPAGPTRAAAVPRRTPAPNRRAWGRSADRRSRSCSAPYPSVAEGDDRRKVSRALATARDGRGARCRGCAPRPRTRGAAAAPVSNCAIACVELAQRPERDAQVVVGLGVAGARGDGGGERRRPRRRGDRASSRKTPRS